MGWAGLCWVVDRRRIEVSVSSGPERMFVFRQFRTHAGGKDQFGLCMIMTGSSDVDSPPSNTANAGRRGEMNDYYLRVRLWSSPFEARVAGLGRIKEK